MSEEQQEDPTVRRLGHLFIIGSVAVLFVAAAVSSIVSDWVRARMQSDFWPLDHSFVGPNLVAAVVQWAIVLLIMAVFYPPMRKAFEASVERHKKQVMDHVSGIAADLHRHLDTNHRKLTDGLAGKNTLTVVEQVKARRGPTRGPDGRFTREAQ